MFEGIVDFIAQTGYLGVFLLMVLENVFPPIPSELIMPLAGFAAAKGELSVAGVLLAGTAGSVFGALPWYYAGYFFGSARLKRLAGRFGRVMTLSPRDVDTACAWFERHGWQATLFGRLVPAVRTLISVPAGMVAMPLRAFLFYSTLGSLVWTGALTAAGYLLHGQYALVADYVDPMSKVVVLVVVGVYLYRLITHKGANGEA